MLQPPCWDSAPSHMQDSVVTWLSPLSYLSFSLFPYLDVSHDSSPGYLTCSLSWQTDRVSSTSNTIACSYQSPVSRDSLGLGLLLSTYTDRRVMIWVSSHNLHTASSVLCLAHGQNLHTPRGSLLMLTGCRPSTAYSLDTSLQRVEYCPLKLKSTWTCECTLIWK